MEEPLAKACGKGFIRAISIKIVKNLPMKTNSTYCFRQHLDDQQVSHGETGQG